MRRTRILFSVVALACAIVTLSAVPTVAADGAPPDQLGFRLLREKFHLATGSGDYDLLLSLWTEDAVFTTGGGAQYFGPEEIADFLSSSPTSGKSVVLTSESKSRFVVNGNRGAYGFECITVGVDDGSPLQTSLAAPQGSQNPAVEILRHTHTTGVLVRDGARGWKFSEFNGAGGPIPQSKLDALGGGN